jgi:hypothetical protein
MSGCITMDMKNWCKGCCLVGGDEPCEMVNLS